MQPPPIASPYAQPEKPLSGRIEWSAANGCFLKSGHSTFGGRFRCEIKSVRFKPGNIIAVTLLFPIFVLLLAATQYGHFKKRVTTMEVWAEGIRLITPERTKLVRWSDMKQPELWGGDLFLPMRGLELIFSARDAYKDAEEMNKMFSILHSLWQSKGANWPAIVSQFAPTCERSLT